CTRPLLPSLVARLPPTTPLFPYTTLFRSSARAPADESVHRYAAGLHCGRWSRARNGLVRDSLSESRLPEPISLDAAGYCRQHGRADHAVVRPFRATVLT